MHRNRAKYATRLRALIPLNLAKFCMISNADVAQSRRQTQHWLLQESFADVMRVFQRKRCTPVEFCLCGASKSNKICDKLCQIHVFKKLSRNFAQFRTPTSRNLAAKRSDDSAKSYADVFRAAKPTLCMPAEFCMRGAIEIEQNLRHVRALSSEILHDFERRRRAISPPNEALTRRRAAPTSCVFCNANGARRPSFACAVHRNRTKFATNSRGILAKFCTISNADIAQSRRQAQQ